MTYDTLTRGHRKPEKKKGSLYGSITARRVCIKGKRTAFIENRKCASAHIAEIDGFCYTTFCITLRIGTRKREDKKEEAL